MKFALAIAVILFSGTSSAFAQDEVSTPDPPIAMLRVEAAIVKSIDSTTIAAPVAGILKSVSIKEGMRVKAGAELAKIRDEAVRIQVEKSNVSVQQAKSKQVNDIDLQIATKSMEVAKNEYERAIDSNEKVPNVFPRNEVDRLRLVMDRSVLEVARAKFVQELLAMEVAVADWEHKQHLELSLRHSIRSPCDGVVVSVDRRPGEWTELGGSIAQIVKTDRLRIEGFLQSEDIDADMIGTKAVVRVKNQDSTKIEAELVFVSPEVNPLNSQVRVFFEVDNEKGLLRPGARPEVILNRK
jgi:multidrug resistance efflux pump